MSSEAREFFSNIDIAKTKCIKLQEQYDKALEWENISVSILSPGRVANDEMVMRIVYVPLHIDPESEELKPNAFDDALDKGLSVNRVQYADMNAIEKNAIKLAESLSQERTPREYQGYVEVNVADVRAEYEYQKRIFAVYDTALEGDQGQCHADVCALLSTNQHQELSKNNLKRLVRGRLSSCFSKIKRSEST